MRRALPTIVLLVAVLASTLGRVAGQQRTLRDVITGLGTDTAGLTAEALDRVVASSTTLSVGGEFGVAYYAQSAPRTEDPLYVAFRARGEKWAQQPLRSKGFGFGSPERMSVLSSQKIMIETHLSPSAGAIAVVRRDLTLAAELFGFFPKELPNRDVVFIRSMVHLAPAQPEGLALYDSRTDRVERLYPIDGSDALAGTAGPANRSPLRKRYIAQLTPLFDEARKHDQRSPYGWDPEWFDVTIPMDSLSFDETTDTLTFGATFSFDRPFPAGGGPAPSMSVLVTCRPMSRPTRTCVEAER